MSLGKKEVDRIKGTSRQFGSSKGWHPTMVRCKECRQNMWSNKKELFCPTCNTYRKIVK